MSNTAIMLSCLWPLMSVAIAFFATVVHDGDPSRFGLRLVDVFFLPVWLPLWLLIQGVKRFPELFQ